ncbi:MAG: DUF4347 domain-containing protein, partial [Cyanobacteria bacterium J06626_18]
MRTLSPLNPVSLEPVISLESRLSGCFGASTSDFAPDPVNLVFIDPTVEAYETLLSGLLPGYQGFVLAADRDGVAQITHWLSEFANVESLHIVSHGSLAALKLGSTTLQRDNLHHYAAMLGQWSQFLADDARLLLYGCHVAEGPHGQAFVQQLHARTGVAIAASSTPVGHPSRGNWNLDYQAGSLTPVLAFDADTLANYPHTLAVDEAFAGIAPVDPEDPTRTGALKVTVKPGGNLQSSTFNKGSFTVENTGDKRIAAIYFDITDAIIPDAVFDPVGLAGDSAFRGLSFKSTGGTGAFEPGNGEALVPFFGVGGADGYEGMLLTFDPDTDNGYDPGEVIQFGVDADPNSIVGLPKKPVDINDNSPLLGNWDLGGISGAELINTQVHVLFTDGTTAVGELMGDDSQGGSVAVVDQDSPAKQATLTVNGIDAGGTGSYSQSNIQMLVSGEAGDMARVVLMKGIVQPFAHIDPDGIPIDLAAQLAGSAFPANHAVEVQTVDVPLDGTVQDITALFDFGAPGTVGAFAGDDTLPIALVASVIDANEMPLGPVTEPVYLEHTDAGVTNTAPITSGIDDVTVTEGAANTVINLFDAFADLETPDPDLLYEVTDNTNTGLFDTVNIDAVAGTLTLDYAATGIGTSDITVTATDAEGLPVATTFAVTVSDPDANTTPTTSGIADVTVIEDAADTVISLFDAFNDAQDPDTALTYEVVGNTNAALFATPPAIDPGTGELTLDYAATGTGTTDITVRATDTGALFVATTFTVTVDESAPPLPDGVIRIEAEDYRAGTNGVEFFDTNGANQGGDFRPGEPVDIETTQDVGGGFNVGWIKSGEFLTYDLTGVAPGMYDITVRVAASQNNKSFTLTVGGQDYIANFNSTGGFQSWQDVVVPGVTINPSDQVLRIDMNTNGFNFNYLDLVPAGPIVNTAPTTDGIADVTVIEGAANTVIPLFDAFEDAQDPDTALTYEVVGNTNEALFATLPVIDPVTGELTLDYAVTGTGTADITVRATDTGDLFEETTFTVMVNEPAANTAPTTDGIANVTVNEGAANTLISLFDAFADVEDPDAALTYEVIANSNPALFAASPAIAPATGELTLDYAATGTGTADITVRATDTGGLFVDTTFTVTVNEVVPPQPGDTIRIEAEDYQAGTNGVEFFDSNAVNQGGAFRPDEPVDIQTTQDVGGGFNVGWIKAGEFLTYDLSGVAPGTYDIAVRVATTKNDKSFTLTVGGQEYTANFDSTGGFQSWQDVVVPGVTINPGDQELRIDMNTGGFNFNYLELTAVEPDETAPEAILSSPTTEPLLGAEEALFTIDYSDNVALESDTFDSEDIQVTAPDGSPLAVTFIGANPPEDSESATATYAIAAPAGGWEFADTGTYTLNILADQVLDTSGNPLAPQQFDLDLTVSDPPQTAFTYGIADIVVLEGASDSVVDLFAAFEDNQDADNALQYVVTENSDPGLVGTAIAGGNLTLDYAANGTGAADITVTATDTDDSSTATTFTATVVTPQADDGAIRINAGGGEVYDDEGNLFQADTFFSGGQVESVSSGQGIAGTKFDALYQTQREGGNFSYSIPVDNGFYVLNAHIVDWDSPSPGQRVFDITVEGESYYDDLDIYNEIRNAFLDGQNTAKIIQGPDKDTTIITNVLDGSLDIDFNASLNEATIAALEIVPLDEPGVLIQESPVEDPETTVSEDGQTVDTYTVALTAPPTAGTVTIDLDFDNAQISPSVTSLDFDSTNWNQPQTVTVSAVNDAIEEGLHTATIDHTVTGPAGSNYEAITIAESVAVNIIDNNVGEISFNKKLITESFPDGSGGPTSGAFGPDGRLYVSTLKGFIIAYELDDNYNVVSEEVIDVVNTLENKDTTGIAFNPYDTEPIIYVSHSNHRANGGSAFPATEFSPYSGQVSTLQKVNGTWEITPLVTGIGVSNHDHGVNGLEFDNNGDLYITSGSNTNAGVADTEIGGIDESPFTTAILKADITDPDFDGNIEYALIGPEDLIQPVPPEFLDSLPPEIFNPPNDLPFDPATSQFWGGYVEVVSGDVEIYASGFRNPYDVEFTTQGFLYATDNNANGGFGDVSTGAYTQEPFGSEQQEELNLITEGAYYGQPNRSRGRTDPRENIYFDSPVDLPAEGYTAPIGTFKGSTNGLIEYRATAFDGQLQGNLLAQKLGGKLFSVELSPDGQQVEEIVNLNNAANITVPNPGDDISENTVADGLDVITGPGGAIVGLDFDGGGQLTVAIPNEPGLTGSTAYDIYPWRAPVAGGQDFVIGGINFDTDPGDTRVFIGSEAATAVEVNGIDVSSNR